MYQDQSEAMDRPCVQSDEIDLESAVHIEAEATRAEIWNSAEAVLRVLDKNSVDQQKAHAELLEQNKDLQKDLKLLLKENYSMKELLSRKYSANSIFLGSSIGIIFFILVLLVDYYFDVILINSILSITGLLICLGFFILSITRISEKN